ncbi:MAG: UDP-2,3-diacylglucosamine diphosphatase [Cytophagales bacterium]|jgi:UDP-2,3-diacylglucosamine pyrophosphatase LpxH|nr:UDP-2,3-diacylglucosamine diphosphatase [Cytophagales bacterium]MCA6367349.1 UDP-2,3-diacylglucosamine diphosphatase [Cytophagales bacterium]MCA6371706.1 UDP-2,3-diacylglucosamine diphosphatase [Cytophagales bacterium]MCA6376166.1 UDP-2,3-diacylglucosamine diphosphatase [Cytophagales bacterium]MCA6383986.1 UDP-2,3-diacylglucosamine diphosphatase [Cytophagales bacterium]
MGKRKRDVELVIISDVHLGTYGCHSEELLRYLKSIKPKRIILNGDIIDMWQFSKRYWPKSHMQVVKHITSLIAKGTKITYLTGNHDEMLRKFAGFRLGSFQIGNKKVLSLNGQSAWVFHGDVFDVTMKYSKWLAKLGAIGYDTLILINSFVNFILKAFGRGKISLSKRVKDSVKQAVKFINDFEQTAADIAISNGYQFVICGHIHQPEMRKITTEKGEVMYLNSGDWVENLTSLEYNQGAWKIYRYSEDLHAQKIKLSKHARNTLDNDEIFKDLVNEFLSTKK